MSFKHNKANMTLSSHWMAFILLAILFLGMSHPEALAQGTNTTNATNATAASAGEISPITVVMPSGSAAATGGGGYEPDPVTVSLGSSIRCVLDSGSASSLGSLVLVASTLASSASKTFI
jgi:hypothetical protein